MHMESCVGYVSSGFRCVFTCLSTVYVAIYTHAREVCSVCTAHAAMRSVYSKPSQREREKEMIHLFLFILLYWESYKHKCTCKLRA